MAATVAGTFIWTIYEYVIHFFASECHPSPPKNKVQIENYKKAKSAMKNKRFSKSAEDILMNIITKLVTLK